MSSSIDPTRSALVVMDMQNGVVKRHPGASELVARAARAVLGARAAGLTIVYVHVGLGDHEAAAVPASNVLFSCPALAWLRSDSTETAIVDGLRPERQDIVVRKTRVGAFSTTDLDSRLRSRGIDKLLLTGIATSGCVLSTLCDAADRDYRIFVIEDLCMDGDAAVHDALLRKIFPRQAAVIDVDRLAALLTST